MRKPPASKDHTQTRSEPDPSKLTTVLRRAKSNRTPELEVAFGARIRAARISARMSQTTLGAAVGISFQQVQKYERGYDRIAASTLQGFATALGVHPGSFYNDVPLPAGSITDLRTARKASETPQQIRDPGVFRCLLSLAKELGEEGSNIARENEAERFPGDNDAPR